MNQRISEILGTIKPFAGEMPETIKALNMASKALIKAQGQGVVGQGIETVKGLFGVDTESQIHNLYSMFYNFKQAWPQMKQSIENLVNTNDPNTEDSIENEQDAKNITQMLIKAISPGLIRGSKAFAFLSPEVFAQELTNIIVEEETGKIFLQPLENLAAKTSKFEKPDSMKLDPTRGGKQQTQSGKATDGTIGSQTTNQTQKTSPTDSTQGTDQTVSAKFQHNMITNSILKKLGREGDQKAAKLINGVMKAITDQGYQLVKPQ